MTADTLQTISLVCFIAAGVLFVLALFLFVYLKIPRVIGDLTGRTARRNIAKLRADNEKGGAKAFRPSNVNLERGPLTETEKGMKAQAAPSGETETMEMIRPAAGRAGYGAAQPAADEEATAPIDLDGTETIFPDDGADETMELSFNPKLAQQRGEGTPYAGAGETAPTAERITQTFTPRPRPEAAPAPAPAAQEETEMLGETEQLGETEMLGGTELLSTPKSAAKYPVTLLEEVMLIHTDEVIA